MSIDTLGTLFDSPARVKIMRLFMLNSKEAFTPSVVAKRSNVSASVARKEVSLLSRAGYIMRKRGGGTGWVFNPKFEYTEELKNLLFGPDFVSMTELAKKFRKAGKIKGVVLSGIFNHDLGARLDLLVVGDKMKKPILERTIRSLEAEIGKELAYAAFDTEEFTYRLRMYDKLVRDVIDFPHHKLISVGGIFDNIPKLYSR